MLLNQNYGANKGFNNKNSYNNYFQNNYGQRGRGYYGRGYYQGRGNFRRRGYRY